MLGRSHGTGVNSNVERSAVAAASSPSTWPRSMGSRRTWRPSREKWSGMPPLSSIAPGAAWWWPVPDGPCPTARSGRPMVGVGRSTTVARLLEEAGQPAVGKGPAPGLAGGAVLQRLGGERHLPDGVAAHRAGLAGSPVDLQALLLVALQL